jgi:regulatory protein
MSSESLELCREKALRLLENSPHSVRGLKRKLYNAGKFTSKDIQTVIDDLLKAKLLDDRQFAEAAIDYLKTTGIGRFKAVFKLKTKGVPQDIIQETMEKRWETADDGDSERAVVVAQQKWRSLQSKKDWSDIKKLQAVARFLAGRGFSPSVIRRILDDLKGS